jgi:hypothetical protein
LYYNTIKSFQFRRLKEPLNNNLILPANDALMMHL